MPDLYKLLHEVVINMVGVGLGIFLIIGARKKWSFLVDPPESLRFFYSQSLIKTLFGSRGAILFCYVVGTLLVLIAGFQMLERLLILGRGLGYWS